jgi:DNA replication protein DnaC
MQDDAGLRGRFRDATFDTFQAKTDEQRQTLDACHAYAEGFAPHHGGGLWLLGNVGTGKTHLASAIVNYLIERGVRSSIVTARGIVQKLRAGWGTRESSEHERRVIEDLSTVPLLVVDEAGYGVTSHLERVQLFDVLDLRYQDRRPTVLVSNLGVRDMRTRLDERLYDRLHDGATVLVFDWESWRAWGNNS